MVYMARRPYSSTLGSLAHATVSMVFYGEDLEISNTGKILWHKLPVSLFNLWVFLIAVEPDRLVVEETHSSVVRMVRTSAALRRGAGSILPGCKNEKILLNLVGLSASEGFVYPGLLVYPVVNSPKTPTYGVEAIHQVYKLEALDVRVRVCSTDVTSVAVSAEKIFLVKTKPKTFPPCSSLSFCNLSPISVTFLKYSELVLGFRCPWFFPIWVFHIGLCLRTTPTLNLVYHSSSFHMSMLPNLFNDLELHTLTKLLYTTCYVFCFVYPQNTFDTTKYTSLEDVYEKFGKPMVVVKLLSHTQDYRSQRFHGVVRFCRRQILGGWKTSPHRQKCKVLKTGSITEPVVLLVQWFNWFNRSDRSKKPDDVRYQAVFEVYKTGSLTGSRLNRSNRPVQTGFQNTAKVEDIFTAPR
ncbi:hypothetical protein LXL04_002197 [Taraxacum kok-saghyz]